MPAAETPQFSPERILEQAQGNVNAIVCITIAYLKERGLPLDDFTTFVGQKFAPSWDGVQVGDAREVAEAALLNLVAGGAEVLGFSGDEQQTEFVVTNSPPPEFLEAAGITSADADAFNNVFHAIAGARGLRFEQQRTGEQVRLRFSR